MEGSRVPGEGGTEGRRGAGDAAQPTRSRHAALLARVINDSTGRVRVHGIAGCPWGFESALWVT